MAAPAHIKLSKNFREIRCHSAAAKDNIFAHKDALMKLTLKQATGFARLTHEQNA